jgi:hypothetical protein
MSLKFRILIIIYLSLIKRFRIDYSQFPCPLPKMFVDEIKDLDYPQLPCPLPKMFVDEIKDLDYPQLPRPLPKMFVDVLFLPHSEPFFLPRHIVHCGRHFFGEIFDQFVALRLLVEEVGVQFLLMELQLPLVDLQVEIQFLLVGLHFLFVSVSEVGIEDSLWNLR